MKNLIESPQRLRAYDIVNGVMHYDFQYIFLKSDDDDVQTGLIYSSDRDKHDFSVFPPVTTQKRFILMEFIHATDDMNMPIYEHDLVSVTDNKSGEEFIGVVFWGYKGCALCWDIDKLSENNKLCKYEFFDKKDTTYSVIGNLHENKDIAKKLYDLKVVDILW